MASYLQTSPYVVPATTAAGINERTVNDKCRNLFSGAAKLMAFISMGQVKEGELTQQAGLIGKKSSNTVKVEGFTYTPIAITFKVVSFGSTTLVLTDNSGLCPRLTLVNTANNTCCRIDSITAGGTTVETTTFGGTAFSASANDILLCMGPAYESASNTPNYVMKDDDNFYNICQIFRYPSAIGQSAIQEKTFCGDFWTRAKQKTMIEGNRRTENTMIFGDRAASTAESTVGGAAYASYFRTARGMWNWAANTYPVGGAMTHDRFISEMVNAVPDIVDDSARVLLIGGNAIYGQILSWVNQKLMYMDPKGGEVETFGAKTTKFKTARFDIEYLRHDAFNRGSNTTRAMIVCPDEWIYYYLNGRDFQVRKGIQLPSFDGQEDEMIGEACMCPTDGGQSTLAITDWTV